MGKSSGFLKKLQAREIIEFAKFVQDILVVLGQLSKNFQCRSITFGEVPQLVSDSVTSLKRLLAA